MYINRNTELTMIQYQIFWKNVLWYKAYEWQHRAYSGLIAKLKREHAL